MSHFATSRHVGLGAPALTFHDFQTGLHDSFAVAKCNLKRTRRAPCRPPYAFTEHGAIMAATVLNSPQAVHMSVAVVRAFVKLRRMALSVEALARKVAALEQKYDANFRDVFQAILQLMTPPDPPRRKIGFDAG